MADAPYSIFNSRTLTISTVKFKRSTLKRAPLGYRLQRRKRFNDGSPTVWYALDELSPEKRKYPVYVISSDTLVETPVIVSYILIHWTDSKR